MQLLTPSLGSWDSSESFLFHKSSLRLHLNLLRWLLRRLRVSKFFFIFLFLFLCSILCSLVATLSSNLAV